MTNDLPLERLAAIEARAEAASLGPWKAYPLEESGGPEPPTCLVIPENESWPEGAVCEVWHGNHDAPSCADFIAHARTDIPDLLAAYKAAREEIERLERHITAARSFLVLGESKQAARKLAEAMCDHILKESADV